MKALRHEVTEEVPVTVLRRHPNVHVCMDEAAAAFVRWSGIAGAAHRTSRNRDQL